MDEYVGDIRQRVLERMDLSREMSDEEIENLIGEEASRLMQEEPISIRERLMLEARVFNSLRKLDALQELLDDPEISEIMVNGPKHIFYEKAGRVHAWNQAFASEEKMQDVIQQIVGRHNRVVNVLHHGLWQLRSVLAAGRGGADGDSEDEENRGDGLHRVAVVWPAV